MRFAFTDDQLAFRDAVADVLAKEAGADAWAALAAMGVAGICVPEADGGMGMSLLDLEPILEAVGRACVPGPIVDTAAVAPVLLNAVGGAAARRLLGEIAAGERTVAVCLEPGVPVERADTVLLAGPDGLVAIERAAVDAAGRAVDSVDPQRSLVVLDAVPATSEPLGAVGDDALEAARRAGAIGTAAVLVGLGDRMLELSVGYAAERKQFGVPIGSFQAVKHHLADATLANEFAKPLVRHAAAIASGVAADPAHPVPAEPAVAASMAKAAASDAAQVVAAQALQCHGAIGYTVEYELHLYLKRTWALAEAWGSAAWHRELLARRLLDA
ncbi:MAG: acyl-CoA dehydrogenase family protein [Acidimicrobiales bacterium]